MSKAKKIVVGLSAGAAILGSAGWWTINHGPVVPAYQAVQIIDGDTFVTSEKQRIRLVSIQAPETGRCYSQESTQLLGNLILGKKLYIKVIYTDSYKRLVSLVYTDKGLVNRQMITQGAAYFVNGYDYDQFREAAVEARSKKLGIYSPTCLPETNLAHPDCVIKANTNLFTDRPPYYRFPGCGQYNNSLVELSQGDAWFCTEKEAKKARFTKASDCFDKTWK